MNSDKSFNYMIEQASIVLSFIASRVDLSTTGAVDIVKKDIQRVQDDLVEALAMITKRERMERERRAAMFGDVRLHQNMPNASFDWQRERAVPPFPPPPPDEPDELDDSDTVDRFGLRDEM